jgi:hypothetical protein
MLLAAPVKVSTGILGPVVLATAPVPVPVPMVELVKAVARAALVEVREAVVLLAVVLGASPVMTEVAMTWERVRVMVKVDVEVSMVVDSAATRRGSASAARGIEKRISSGIAAGAKP